MFYQPNLPRAVAAPSLATRATALPNTPSSIYLSPARAFQSRIVLFAADLASFALATAALTHNSVDLGAIGTLPIALGSVVLLMFLLAEKICKPYQVTALQNIQKGCVSAVETCAVTLGGLVAVAGASGASGAFQLEFTVWPAVAIPAVLIVRLAYFSALSAFPAFFKERVLLIGTTEQIQELVQDLKEKRSEPCRIIGYVSTSSTKDQAQLPLLGDLQGIDSLSAVGDFDRIILLDEKINHELFVAIAPKLRATPFEVGIRIPTLAHLRVPKSYALSRNSTFQLQSPPLKEVDLFVKRVEDLVLSAILLLMSLPVMLIIAILIKLDSPGPVLFRQKRWGFNGKSFEVYKFRTMFSGAENDPRVAQATRDDPRITRVGRILRRSSLDELPQLFNVIGGNMSLIGPRPHAVEHNQYFAEAIDGYLARHHVLPGMSGWAQVNGCRGETRTIDRMKKRLDYDLYYIARWSVGFDLYIFLRTIATVIVGKNAY